MIENPKLKLAIVLKNCAIFLLHIRIKKFFKYILFICVANWNLFTRCALYVL